MADLTESVTRMSEAVEKLQGAAGGAGADPTQALGGLLGSLSPTNIGIMVLAGLVGSWYFVAGKKAGELPKILAGAALCIIPNFIGSTPLLIATCLALLATPYLAERYL